MYKVRFNLGAGDNYMKWRITHPNGKHTYHEPSEVVLRMTGCKLKNNVTGAKKIYEGSHKYVVAWVEAETVVIMKKTQLETYGEKISYNPRVTPHWMHNGEVVDGVEFESMVSVNRSLHLQ